MALVRFPRPPTCRRIALGRCSFVFGVGRAVKIYGRRRRRRRY